MIVQSPLLSYLHVCVRERERERERENELAKTFKVGTATENLFLPTHVST
jgi:hypothetical protein